MEVDEELEDDDVTDKEYSGSFMLQLNSPQKLK